MKNWEKGGWQSYLAFLGYKLYVSLERDIITARSQRSEQLSEIEQLFTYVSSQTGGREGGQ